MGKLGDITLTKQTGTTLTLATNGKYVNSDVSFDIAVRSGAGAVTIASTDATIQSDTSGRNISGVIGTKASTQPSSGYYIKVQSEGTGSSTITTAGWLNLGSMGTASATGTYYFPVTAGTATVSGINTVTPTASISGSNVTLSNTDNGVSVTATGGGSASASVTASGETAGYVEANAQIGTGTIAGANTTTVSSAFISGVTLGTPQTGTNQFSITVPNGSSTATFTFTVDTSGNVTVS